MATAYTVLTGPPTSVYPYAKQGVCSITNDGAVDLYASETAVALNGTLIPPGNTLRWPPLTALYLYALVAGATASVYEGEPTTATNVTATVPNALTVSSITSPVLIQGGGSLLYVNTLTLVSGETRIITLQAPLNGLVYYALKCALTVTPQVNVDTQVAWTLDAAVNTGADFTMVAGSIVVPKNPATFSTAAYVGRCITPVTGGYEYRVVINNNSAGSLIINLRLDGVTAMPTEVTTDIFADNTTTALMVKSVNISTTPVYYYLPISFTPYALEIYNTSAAAGAGANLEIHAGYGGGWVTQRIGLLQQADFAAHAAMPAGGMGRVTAGGHGFASRLFLVGTAAGSLSISTNKIGA